MGLTRNEKKELASAIMGAEEKYPKRLIAKAFGVSKGTLYYKNEQPEKDKGIYERMLKEYEVDDTLGCRKLAVLLEISKNRALRVMIKYGLRPRRKRGAYKYPGQADTVVGNILLSDRDLRNSEILFSDIFQFRLADRTRIYGCFVILKKTRQILTFCYGYSMPGELVSESVRRVDLGQNMSEMEVIFHSDQGSQYGAKVTIEACIEQHFERSMSRAGTPTDNGMAERFVGLFKLAVTERYKYENVLEFEEFATRWLNFYNNRRPHQSLGQKSPNDFAEENGMQKLPYLSLNFV